MTEQQKAFAKVIISATEKRDTAIVVGLLLKEPEQMDEMVDFLIENEGAADDMILKEALKISGAIKD